MLKRIGCCSKSGNRGSIILISFLLGSLCLQNVDIIELGSFAIKPFHIITVILLVYSIFVRKSTWTIPCKAFTLAALLFLSITLLDVFRFGLSGFFFKYVYFFLLICVVYNLGFRLNRNEWESAVRVTSYCVLAICLCNCAMQYRDIISFLHNPWHGHPYIDTLFSGGVNLEASWISLFGCFCLRNRAGVAYLLCAFLLSSLYASRTGMLLCAFAALYVFLIRNRDRSIVKKIVIFAVVLLVGVIALMAFGDVIVARFLNISSEEGGTAGRLHLWEYAAVAFSNAPLLGNGAGNAVGHMSELTGAYFPEDNVHNYPLQILLDSGLVGFSVYFALVVNLFWNFAHEERANPFAGFLVAYIFASLLQFAGADAILGFMIAGYFATRNSQNHRIMNEANNHSASWRPFAEARKRRWVTLY